MKRRALMFAALVLLLVWAAGWAAGRLGEAHQAAATAEANYRQSRELLARLGAISREGPVAEGGRQMAGQIRQAVEASARKAGIPSSELIRISPDSPQRLGESPYKQVPIRIRVGRASARQATVFLHDLAGSASLHPDAVTMRAPREANPGEDVWSVDLVVTYLIYDPAERSR